MVVLMLKRVVVKRLVYCCRKRIMALIVMLIVAPLLLPQVYAYQSQSLQDITWVTVESSVPIVGNDLEKAREQAITEAETKAIESVVVADISLDTLLVNLKLSGSMVGAIPYVEIAETIILEESPSQSDYDPSNAVDTHCKLKVKIGVAVEVSGSDPGFAIDASLNKVAFVDGEEMTITLKPTTDCFYAIFIMLEDQKVLKLIPNSYKTDNYLAANTSYTLPDEEDRAKGILLKVSTPEEKHSVSESVYVVALKQPISFESGRIQEAVFGIYDGQTAFIQDLVRQIVHIPLRDRAEKLIQYHISKP